MSPPCVLHAEDGSILERQLGFYEIFVRFAEIKSARKAGSDLTFTASVDSRSDVTGTTYMANPGTRPLTRLVSIYASVFVAVEFHGLKIFHGVRQALFSLVRGQPE